MSQVETDQYHPRRGSDRGLLAFRRGGVRTGVIARCGFRARDGTQSPRNKDEAESQRIELTRSAFMPPLNLPGLFISAGAISRSLPPNVLGRTLSLPISPKRSYGNCLARRFNSRPSACNTLGLPAKLGTADNFAECLSLRKPRNNRMLTRKLVSASPSARRVEG